MDRLGTTATLVLMTVWSVSGAVRTQLIADFEDTSAHTAGGQVSQPSTSLTPLTASQGRRSLRFEYSGTGQDRASVTLPVPHGAEGFNAVAFDVYCEADNGSSLIVSVRQETEKEGTAARYKTVLPMADFIDGWTPVRLIRDATMVFKQDGGVAPDWSRIRTVSLSVAGHMNGKVIYYLDNVRFEDVGEGKTNPNMLYNSSFEIASNPDVPDGWTRDLSVPPYGRDVWGTDPGTAYHGKQSLRISVPGKYVRSWGRHTRVVQGRDYTFSVYLRAAAPETRAELDASGIVSKVVTVGPTWQRYSVTGPAKRSDTMCYVWLRSAGVLWVDAAQLEMAGEPSPYAPGPADGVDVEDRVEKKRRRPVGGADEAVRPRVHARRAAHPPVLDGELTDECWRKAAMMTPFVRLTENVPAERKTVARLCYDDDAFYIAMRAEDPDMQAVSDALEGSEHGPWGTDLLEIFLDLNHDRDTYYQFAANAKGERWQARHTKKSVFAGAAASWACDWAAAGSTDPAGWTVEVAIPFTCFDLRPLIDVGTTIGLNVCRQDPRSKRHSSWSFSYGAFHVPEAFGMADGLDVDLHPYRLEIASLTWRRGTVAAAIANHVGADQSLTVDFVADGPDSSTAHARVAARVAAGEEAALSAALTLTAEGTHRVSARVSDADGHLRLVSQPLVVRVSGETMLHLDGTEYDFYTRAAKARTRCFVELDAARCAGMKLRWWLARDGQPVHEPAVCAVVPGENPWAVPLETLPSATYAVHVALEEHGHVLAAQQRAFRKLPPVAHDVRINQWGRFLVCDGEPVLWYGFYDSLGRGTDQRWIDALTDMQGVHANAVLNYIGGRADYDRVGWALDQAQARGMRMWVHLGWMLSYWIPKYEGRSDRYDTREQSLAHLREVVTRHRQHPALLGWCTLDEPGNRPSLFTKEVTERHYRLVKELDPYHPCIFSHLTRLGESDVYGAATDLYLMPFVERDRRHDSVFWEFWDTGLPVATNSPCYGALSGTVREPTPAEQRIRTYKALILGARGICSYTYRCASVGTWHEFRKLGAELRELAPVLLTPDNRLRVDVTPSRPDLCALLKSSGDGFCVLVVNADRAPVEAVLRLLDVPRLSRVVPRFGAAGAVRVDADTRTIAVRLPGQSTAVYDIR